MRSAILVTSRSLWVMITIAAPCSASDFKVSKSASISTGPRTAVGSSRIRMSAPA